MNNLQIQPEIKEIAEAFLKAFKTRDWDLMYSVLNEDVTWTLPGKSLLSGPASGAAAVVGRAGQLRDFGVLIEVKHILPGLNSVALLLHNTARRGELVLDQQVAIVCGITDGKISKITTHLSDVPNIEAFFVSGVLDK